MALRQTATIVGLATALVLMASAPPASAAPHDLTTAQIAALALPAVVSITVRDKTGNVVKSGSGFVVMDGVVATNQHVVMGAHDVTVNFSDGNSVTSTFFWIEKTRYDLALISCDTGNVKPLTLADSSNVQIGSDVVAIGSPEGLNGSVSTGIISGIRTIPERGNAKVFQTTAPISPGSSGGPLLDMQGRVIGMNSFYLIHGENLNFAYASGYITDAWNSFRLDIKRGQAEASVLLDWDDVPSLTDLPATASASDISDTLDRGADLNATAPGGLTALMKAAAAGETDCVTALLAAGADTEPLDVTKETALIYASMNGNVDCVRELVGAGADLNAKDKDGWTAIIAGAVQGHADCIAACAQAGADLELRDNNGDTALIAAAEEGHGDCVKVLIGAGANVNAKDTDIGGTALMYACMEGHADCVDALITAGAYVDLKDNIGDTALSLARDPAIVARLRAAGATE